MSFLLPPVFHAGLSEINRKITLLEQKKKKCGEHKETKVTVLTMR